MKSLNVVVQTEKSCLWGLMKWCKQKSVEIRVGESFTFKYHRGKDISFSIDSGTKIKDIRVIGDEQFIDIECRVHEMIPDTYIKTITASSIIDLWPTGSSEAWKAVVADMVAYNRAHNCS